MLVASSSVRAVHHLCWALFSQDYPSWFYCYATRRPYGGDLGQLLLTADFTKESCTDKSIQDDMRSRIENHLITLQYSSSFDWNMMKRLFLLTGLVSETLGNDKDDACPPYGIVIQRSKIPLLSLKDKFMELYPGTYPLGPGKKYSHISDLTLRSYTIYD